MFDSILPITQKDSLQRRYSARARSSLIFIGGEFTKSNPSSNRAIEPPANNVLLDETRIKDWIEITQIHLDKSTHDYLDNLGIKSGTIAEIVSKTVSGSVIIRIKRQQIGLGAEIARQLVVKFVNEQNHEN